jgi:hypothetical protein
VRASVPTPGILAAVIQPDLFSGTQVLQRTLPASGTVVRLRLRPLGGGRVRIEEAVRRMAGAGRFEPWPGETGREVAFERLGFAVAYGEVFGGG